MHAKCGKCSFDLFKISVKGGCSIMHSLLTSDNKRSTVRHRSSFKSKLIFVRHAWDACAAAARKWCQISIKHVYPGSSAETFRVHLSKLFLPFTCLSEPRRSNQPKKRCFFFLRNITKCSQLSFFKTDRALYRRCLKEVLLHAFTVVSDALRQRNPQSHLLSEKGERQICSLVAHIHVFFWHLVSWVGIGGNRNAQFVDHVCTIFAIHRIFTITLLWCT